MKWLKVFSVFVVLHGLLWVAAHVYKSLNPEEVLVGVDTSFVMTEHFPAMQQWIADYAKDSRYETIMVVTDKEPIGGFEELSSLDSIFRSAFGLSDASNFQQYQKMAPSKRFLLSDGRFVMQDWELVKFE